MDTNTISRIQKAKQYANEPHRVTFENFELQFKGDNDTYTTMLGAEGWHCSCPGFQKYAICPHIMALEKIFSVMLKRDPTPYASGQNIVSDVKKATRYAEETERIRFVAFSARIDGDNSVHRVQYSDNSWQCDCEHFQQRDICAHTDAMERLLGDMVAPIVLTPAKEEVGE